MGKAIEVDWKDYAKSRCGDLVDILKSHQANIDRGETFSSTKQENEENQNG
jgi:hypothetical protein